MSGSWLTLVKMGRVGQGGQSQFQAFVATTILNKKIEFSFSFSENEKQSSDAVSFAAGGRGERVLQALPPESLYYFSHINS